MADTYVDPAVIQRVVEPGATETQRFYVRNPPDGTITANIVGDRTNIRLREMTASTREVVHVPPDPDAQGHQDDETTVVYTEVARIDGEGTLATRYIQIVEGEIEFTAPAGAPMGLTESVLHLKLDGAHRGIVDVPLKRMTGRLYVRFDHDPVVAYQGQSVSVQVQVTLPPGHPAAVLQLQLTGRFDLRRPENDWLISRTLVPVSGGETVAAVLTLVTAATAPLGESVQMLNVRGFDGAYGVDIPVKIMTAPYSKAIEANDRIEAKAADLVEGPPGDYVPVSPTKDAGDGGFVRHYSTGDIYYHESTGAHWVYGAILHEYIRAGGPGVLGYPLNDESDAAGGGRFNAFQHGSIYFTAATGAHIVRGRIRDQWMTLGAEQSYLGYPTSSENPVADPKGRTWLRFQRGTVHSEDEDQSVFHVADTRLVQTGVINVDGAAANGWAELTLTSAGVWRYTGSMRSTGALSYDVVMTSVVDVGTSLGRGLAFTENGDVEGTLVLGGNRAHTWDQHGEDPFIKDNWEIIRNARVVTQFKVDFGPGDVLAIIATVIGLPVAAIALAAGLAFLAKDKKPCGYATHEVWDAQRGEWIKTTGAVFVDRNSMCPVDAVPNAGDVPADR